MNQIINAPTAQNKTLHPEHLLQLNDPAAIIDVEALGFVRAERYAFGLEPEMPVSPTLIQNIHRIAFYRLYDWAGKWRDTGAPRQQGEDMGQRMLDFTNNLNYRIATIRTREDEIACLTYTHYTLNRIQPFRYGNGRTASIILNLVALKLGYRPLTLCHSQAMQEAPYREAMAAAEKGNMATLHQYLDSQLIFL